MLRTGIALEQKAEQMRERNAPPPRIPCPPGTFAERHYTVAEIAAMWSLSQDAIRKTFHEEPGVLAFGSSESKRRRKYTTLRIPESVVQRVHRRMTKV